MRLQTLNDSPVLMSQRHVAMATSTDGINWSKPSLNATGNFYSDDPNNNFISHSATNWANGATVFVDPSAPDHERFKNVVQGATRTHLVLQCVRRRAFTSPRLTKSMT